MPPSESAAPSGADWRGWLALTWALIVGALYARMLLEQRGAMLLEWVEKATSML